MIATYNKYYGKLKRLERYITDIKKGEIQLLFATYENRKDPSNKNKKYYIESNKILQVIPDANVQKDIELEYDDIDNFYKEFDLNNKNIRLITFDIIDTTEAERAFWQQMDDD